MNYSNVNEIHPHQQLSRRESFPNLVQLVIIYLFIMITNVIYRKPLICNNIVVLGIILMIGSLMITLCF